MIFDTLYPGNVRRIVERNELTRQCAQRIVDSADAGRLVDPYSLEWARQFVLNVKPLGRPLGAGESA